ncbi:MAG: hypothetical protein IPI04_08865 [Ignavibacteria bacterium]|nr:hypothetical protein [Ignavibacteria bacterium]
MLLINPVVLVFGNESKIIQNYYSSSFDFSELILTQIQFIQFIISIVILTIILLFGNSRFYLKIKAVMSNQDVASVLGINFNSIRIFSVCFGSVLAAIACILRLYDTGINPYSGLSMTLSAAVVVILGGDIH